MLRIEVSLLTVCIATLLASQASGPSGRCRARGEEQATDAGPGSAGEVPEGLTTSDWFGIRKALEADRFAALAVEGGFQARNPCQSWRTHFDGRGFTVRPDAGGWEWGLELQHYGFAKDERSVSDPSHLGAAGQRVAYDWDGILEEWYVNDTRGLEHGFTVRERPPRGTQENESGPLCFMLAVRGELHPDIEASGRSVRFVDDLGAPALTYSGLSVLDADGKELAAGFERSGEGLLLSIQENGARYPLTIDPLVQQAYLKASNPGGGDIGAGVDGDWFGFSVSVSGDTVVVGAPNEDSNATGVNGSQGDDSGGFESGAAYVFVRNGRTWSQQAYLKASNTGGLTSASTANCADCFGHSVSVSGDTIVVGAPGEDSNATGVNGDQSNENALNSGAAYVFVRNGTTWSQEAYLKASNTGGGGGFVPGDAFGTSVSVSGDIVVVGAPEERSGATTVNGDQSDDTKPAAGAAYVFVRSGTSWSQEAYLKAFNTNSGDYFGSSVATSDDRVVVGAPLEDGINNNLTDSGAAYVFVSNGGIWSQQAYMRRIVSAGAQLGFSVAISGVTVVLGAPEDASSAGPGSAWVYRWNGTSWIPAPELEPSPSALHDSFGHSVGVSGDRVVVGESFAGVGDTGAAYSFVRNGTSWTQEAYLEATNKGSFDHFGWSIAVSGSTVVVGAQGEDSSSPGVNGDQSDNSAMDAGAAYVFDECAPPPAVASRNAGTNPPSYVALAFGATFIALVDNALASQLSSVLFAFDTPVTLTLAGGQTLLCLDLGGSGELFTGSGLYPSMPSIGGTDLYSLTFANDPSLCGMVFYSQAIHAGFPPFVLSNAQDLTVGPF